METIIDMVKVTKLNKCLMKGKTLAMIEGIERGTICTREDAKLELFKNSASPEQALKKFLRRVRRTLNLSIMASLQPNTPLQEIYREVYTSLSAVMMMLAAGKRTPAIKEARRIYNIATHYEFLEVAALLANRLAKNYAEAEPNARLNKRFSAEATQYANLVQINTLSNTLYSDAIIRINNRSSYSQSAQNKIKHYLDQLHKDRMASIDICTQYHTLKVIQCFAKQDYARAILCCNEVLEYFDKQQIVRASQKAIFLSFSSISAIAAKKYTFAEQCLQQAIAVNGFSNHNWQVYTYYRAINALHQGLYYRARHLYDEAARREQTPYIEELWAIIGAYCAFFTDSPFKLGKFFNETIVASQDKEGSNVNIIIADLLLSLTNNPDRFILRIEAVQTYIYRYLKGPQHERVRLFLRLLFLVAKKDFDVRRIRKAGAYLLARLEKRSVYANHNMEIELVRWEVAWEMVLERIDGKEERMVN